MRREQVSAIITLLEPSDALQLLTAVRPVGMLPFGGRYRWLISLSKNLNADSKTMVTVPRSGRSWLIICVAGDWSLNTPRRPILVPINDLKLVAQKRRPHYCTITR